MPSKGPAATSSKSLVSRSAKPTRKDEEEVFSKALVRRGEKNAGPHPSTSRALVLRKAAWGSGEIAITRKISGQEKLMLLAEEMMKNAVRAPFRMEEVSRIAQSQLGVHVDEISNLKDPAFFYDDIMAMIDSATPLSSNSDDRRRPADDPNLVASTIGYRIHNVYLLAGSWRIIRNVLRELAAMGLDDRDVRDQLMLNEKMLAKYLVLYDTVTMLARMGQQRVANLAAATPHYAPYFVRKPKQGSGEPEMEFDHRGNNRRKIREAHKSYIDAIILELVLPDSRYPPYVLMACLHDAVEECRKEEKRFTQALWDSVGDLAVTIQVLDLLEAPLLGPGGETWVQDADHLRHLSKEFFQFLVAQSSSAEASTKVEAWKLYLRPLTETKKRHVLANLWLAINRSYQMESGVGIDTLWELQQDLQPSPQWSTIYIPGLDVDDDSDSDPHALTLHKNAKRNKGVPSKKALQITQGGEETSDDDIPGLMSVSDSSEDADDDSAFESEELSEGDSESDFDTEEDEQLHDMLKEALLNATIDIDELPEIDGDKEMSKNPFTRMLANLKDRYFSANPTLKATEQSRRPFKPRPGDAPPSSATPRPTGVGVTPPTKASAPDVASRAPLGPTEPSRRGAKPMQNKTPGRSVPLVLESEEELPPLVPPGEAAPKWSQKTTIEEVEDEDNEDQSKKKKKKKKKKSKKFQEVPTSPLASPVASPSPVQSQAPSPSKGNKGSPAKQSPRQSSIHNPMEGLDANFSRASLPLTRETTAQSARSYLQSENLTTEKAKVKSRPAFAESFFKSDKNKGTQKSLDGEKEKKGFLSRIKKPLIHLPKRTGDLMGRLISSADGKTHAKKPMKWEEFLKLMRDMGFSYDPSTAGSSVRFDPPDPKDASITFHKPHPDPTLQRGHLRDFGKRLGKAYGWSEEQFSNFVGHNEDD